MRFAVKTAPEKTSWDDLLAVWRAADEIELYESAWSFDHFEPIYGDRSGPCLEGWTTLAALAQATSRLRVGLMVTGTPYRHPAVLANMAAAVDIVSGGRLELGLGAGWNEKEAGAYGIDLLPIRQRMDRFDEACDVVVGLLTHDRFSYEGEHFTIDGGYCEPKAVQAPHPPICIGGSGEKLVEGFYNLLLTERLRLTFNLQHVLESPAGSAKYGYLLPGVRLQASF